MLCAVFPTICSLRLTDSTKLMIDKIYFSSKRTESELQKLIEYLNYEESFGKFAKTLQMKLVEYREGKSCCLVTVLLHIQQKFTAVFITQSTNR